MENKSFFISIAALLVTAFLVGMILLRPQPQIVATRLEHLPRQLGHYQGADDSFPESVNRELNADARLYRHYRSEDGSRVDLYIGYYGTAKGGRTPHTPYGCLPGAGWAIVDAHKIPVAPSSVSVSQPLNYIQARKDGVNTIMFHWYQSAGGKVISTGLQQNINKFWGRLLRNRNDGAFVQVSMQVLDDQLTDARGKLQRFAGQVLEVLPAHWPLEK